MNSKGTGFAAISTNLRQMKTWKPENLKTSKPENPKTSIIACHQVWQFLPRTWQNLLSLVGIRRFAKLLAIRDMQIAKVLAELSCCFAKVLAKRRAGHCVLPAFLGARGLGWGNACVRSAHQGIRILALKLDYTRVVIHLVIAMVRVYSSNYRIEIRVIAGRSYSSYSSGTKRPYPRCSGLQCL